MSDVASLGLGADLRTLRKARGLTLSDLAEQLGRSVGWLSQVERNLSGLTPADLGALAKALGVAPTMLAPKSEEGVVVRKGSRRAIGPRVAGLTEELLSPDLTDDFEMVHSTFAPGAQSDGTVCRPTQEVGYLILGQLDLTIGQQDFTVGPGDSFRLRGEPFSWCNSYAEPAVAIWVIAPPVY